MLNQALRQAGEAMPSRAQIERAIDALIDLLDATDPEPDMEPNLGWTWSWAGCLDSLCDVDDREEDADIEEDYLRGDDDSTPSLNDRPLAYGEER